jgi:hypothetical protein
MEATERFEIISRANADQQIADGRSIIESGEWLRLGPKLAKRIYALRSADDPHDQAIGRLAAAAFALFSQQRYDQEQP